MVSGQWIFHNKDSKAGICGDARGGLSGDGADWNEARDSGSFSKTGGTFVGGEKLEACPGESVGGEPWNSTSYGFTWGGDRLG